MSQRMMKPKGSNHPLLFDRKMDTGMIICLYFNFILMNRKSTVIVQNNLKKYLNKVVVYAQ